ncbi:hypothetical protein EJ02DRAFT_494865 [Clathrospora elynae]|uniref:Uncharacterized protein n=1 Tax=Clathrospora elynae TaxID=706981 RepID=A0A6A5SIG6_9PLEO|nr:hypothetical protein EJ02DRAFT_494865 [Clathrospora elynae]
MPKLVRRLRRTLLPQASRKFHILAAPSEIRLAIYEQIAPRGFLPYTHYRAYAGLFLSCKQIHNEMEYESLRAAPEILLAIQMYYETPMKIRPLRPASFSSLMHVTIGIPRWALFSTDILEDIFEAITPLMKLHLSSLTIGIEDLECQDDLLHLLRTLDPGELSHYLDAVDDLTSPILPRQGKEMIEYYGVRTTYADIVELATAINCLVAPQLCHGKHDKENHWCIRAYSIYPPPAITCNIRKIFLRLKKLHDEIYFPPNVYLCTSVRLRWSPTDETSRLRKEGWCNMWTDEHGTQKLFSKQMPAQFIWCKLEKQQHDSFQKKLKGLLKGS